MKQFIYRKLHRIYAIYRKHHLYVQKRHHEKIAFGYLKDARRILDIGCGVGQFIGLDPKRIEGLDLSKRNVGICQRKGYKVTQGSATKLPFKDGEFDGIFSAHLIEHLEPEAVYQFLQEINRVLKKDGVLAIAGPLFYKDFYNDLTHIRPYPPRAIFHYLRIKPPTENQSYSREEIGCLYKLLKIKYRRRPYFKYIEDSSLWYLAPIFLIIQNLCEKIGMGTQKSGFLLIMKKIK